MMNIEEIREYCLNKAFTEECLPFDEWTLVFKVHGKMFAMLPLDKPYTISLKCNPRYSLELRETHQGINPAWHMNKKHWNQVSVQGDIDDMLLTHLIDHSYTLVFNKLPMKLRESK